MSDDEGIGNLNEIEVQEAHTALAAAIYTLCTRCQIPQSDDIKDLLRQLQPHLFDDPFLVVVLNNGDRTISTRMSEIYQRIASAEELFGEDYGTAPLYPIVRSFKIKQVQDSIRDDPPHETFMAYVFYIDENDCVHRVTPFPMF
jgi:hypothetical protein